MFLLSSLSLVPQFTLGQGGGSLFEQPRIQREMREPTLILGSHLRSAVPQGLTSLTDGPYHPALPFSLSLSFLMMANLSSLGSSFPLGILLLLYTCWPAFLLPQLLLFSSRATGRISDQPPSTHLGFSLPYRRFISLGYWLCEEGPRFSGRGLFGGPVQVGG